MLLDRKKINKYTNNKFWIWISNFEFTIFLFFLRRDFPITIIITICRCFSLHSFVCVRFFRSSILDICSFLYLFLFLFLIWLIIVSNFSIFSIWLFFVDIFYMFKKKETSNFIRLQRIYIYLNLKTTYCWYKIVCSSMSTKA